MSTFEFPTPDLLAKVRELITCTQLGSEAMVQRKFNLSFAQAARCMEILEEEGTVGPKPPSGGAREVLVPSPITEDGRTIVTEKNPETLTIALREQWAAHNPKEDTPMLDSTPFQCQALKLGDGTRCTKHALYQRLFHQVCATHARVIDETDKIVLFIDSLENRPATQAFINKEATPAPTVPKEDTMTTPTPTPSGEVQDTTFQGRVDALVAKFGPDSNAVKAFLRTSKESAIKKGTLTKGAPRPAAKVHADSDTVKVTCTGIVGSDEKGRPVIHGLVQAKLADVKGVRKFVCDDCAMNQDTEAESEINAEMAVEHYLESHPVEDDPNEGIQFIDEL